MSIATAWRGRGKALSIGLVLAALLAGAVLYQQREQWTGGSQDLTEAATQRIVYRVEDSSQLPVRLTTQVLDVSLPYTARLLTLSGPPPGESSLGGLAWDVSHQYLIEAGGSVREIQQTPPSFPGGLAHLDVALPTALRFGLVRRQGTAQVAGSTCTEWVSREPLDGAEFSLPTSTNRVVTCVAGNGHILRERWTLDGRLVRLRTAVSVETGPNLSGSGLLAGEQPIPAPSDLSSEPVKEVSVERLAQALGLVIPAPPPGLELDRSVATVTIDRSGATPQTVREGAVISFTDGRRLVVLSLKRGLAAPLKPPTSGVPVTVPGLGAARLTPIVSGLRLELLTARGLLVVITGDLQEQALLDWAGRLQLD